jgi:hypothetical protein
MKRWVVAGALISALAGGVAFWLLRSRDRTPSARNQEQASHPGAKTASSTNRARQAAIPFGNTSANTVSNSPALATTTSRSHAPLPYVLGSPEVLPSGFAPPTILENARSAIRQYGATFGGNPVGTNPEITAALNGGNPKEIKFISEDAGLRINGEGALVDFWGTPFFFHQLSATETEIRSAGPDRIMWTSDDLVTK